MPAIGPTCKSIAGMARSYAMPENCSIQPIARIASGLWVSGISREALRINTGSTHRTTDHSDDFEVAVQLPVADMPPVFTFLPFAAGGEMLDERIAEQLAGRRGAFQALRRIPQRAWQG